MPTRNVVLTDHHEQVIEDLVRSGRYLNASEVLREGIRLIEMREAEDKARLEALRATAYVGAAQVDEGDLDLDGDFIAVDDDGLPALFDAREDEAQRRAAAQAR